MMKTIGQILVKETLEEIQKAFDNWDSRIEAGQKPVPIQDLDFWVKNLKIALQNWDVVPATKEVK